MDRVSSVMLRASFVWLLLGFVVGALMLTDRTLSGEWRGWAAPTHGHALFVGWFVQFAIGVAYWLLPRRRSAARPQGYDERGALVAVAALNLGLILRGLAEPVERAGPDAAWTAIALPASALMQVLAVVIFVWQLWPRVGPRPIRRLATNSNSAAAPAARGANRSY